MLEHERARQAPDRRLGRRGGRHARDRLRAACHQPQTRRAGVGLADERLDSRENRGAAETLCSVEVRGRHDVRIRDVETSQMNDPSHVAAARAHPTQDRHHIRGRVETNHLAVGSAGPQRLRQRLAGTTGIGNDQPIPEVVRIRDLLVCRIVGQDDGLLTEQAWRIFRWRGWGGGNRVEPSSGEHLEPLVAVEQGIARPQVAILKLPPTWGQTERNVDPTLASDHLLYDQCAAGCQQRTNAFERRLKVRGGMQDVCRQDQIKLASGKALRGRVALNVKGAVVHEWDTGEFLAAARHEQWRDVGEEVFGPFRRQPGHNIRGGSPGAGANLEDAHSTG